MLESRFVTFLIERMEDRLDDMPEEKELALYVGELRSALDVLLGAEDAPLARPSRASKPRKNVRKPTDALQVHIREE